MLKFLTLALSLLGAALAQNTPAQEEANKAVVLQLFKAAFQQDNPETLSSFYDDQVQEHTAAGLQDKTSALQGIAQLKSSAPGLVASIKHIAADGDLVAVHWQASSTPEDEFSGEARMDLYRVSAGKVIEHWSAHQRVPFSSASGNSLFSDLYVAPKDSPEISEEQEEANKQLVIGSYAGLFNDLKMDLLDQNWDPNYLQHNPYVGNGLLPLKRLVGSLGPSGAGLKFVGVVADGDLVFVFSGGNSVQGDLFRVSDNKLSEHWDVLR
ncbi:nuclear transport factor 2 family protein [Deinococcus roseus]|uniref:Polyketide cyclase n=1 Tax=Deinococcus roseus TaxID=392414 RepID=A0ABQ2D4C7_9DEIO|nr:nuclear transport factor 2 family protein [Deinococcus roseus]GGJ42698.1 polyketide cyclase [Deinococcus roseus]